MQIRLIEQLQKISEEDLFPNASPEDVRKRKLDRKVARQKLLDRFKVGDKVRIRGLGRTRTIIKVLAPFDVPAWGKSEICVEDADGSNLWPPLEGIVKVLESKINEADLFPNASEEDIVVRKKKQVDDFIAKTGDVVSAITKIFPLLKKASVRVYPQGSDYSYYPCILFTILNLCDMTVSLREDIRDESTVVGLRAELGTLPDCRSISIQTIGYWDMTKKKYYPPMNGMNIEIIKKHLKELTKGKSS